MEATSLPAGAPAADTIGPAGDRPRDAEVLEEFDGYRLVSEIGRGAMGTVFLAHDTVLDRAVAVKFLDVEDPAGAARERFRREARAIARVQHPNVVGIHRVGEAGGRPYIVSEFVRGKPLHQLPLPVGSAQALRIGTQLARGLSAAHRRGVLHRDIKPANAVISDEGEVKLLDFGLAHLFDDGAGAERAAFVGTPAYMAPELWTGAPGTFRTDVFALGALLYELCAGAPPFAGAGAAQVGEQIAHGSFAPLVRAQAETPLAKVIARCLEADPSRRYADGEAVREALEALSPGRRLHAIPEGNPYRGLQSFQAEHRALFFGRDPDIRAVVDRLRTEPCVVIAGTSGVGKSSLCRAGVLPWIEAGGLEDGVHWRAATLTPGRHPLMTVAATLARFLDEDEGALLERLRSDWPQVARSLRARQNAGSGLIVFFDQLEELVTVSDPEEARAVAELIESLASFTPALRVVATIRGDFIARVGALPALCEVLPRALYLLRPLSEDALREAVLGPARATGLTFETEQMVEALLRASAPDGALPLLQFTLAELWDRRDAQAQLIPLSALQSLGGVEGALARHADGVLAQLLPEVERAARRILLRLVTLDDTRARRTELELLGKDVHAAAALAALVRGRLLVASQTEDTWAYEVAHEALIARWPTLRRWLDEAREQREVQARLEASVAEWKRLGKNAALWNASQLTETQALDAAELDDDARAFLLASGRALRMGRRLRWGLVVLVVAAIAGVWAAALIRQRIEVDRRAGAHEARGRALLASALDAKAQLGPQREAALSLFAAGELTAAEGEWETMTGRTREVDRALANASQEFEAALAVDAARPHVRSLLAQALFERALIAELLRQREERDELAARLSVYDDGTWTAAWNQPAHLQVDAPTAVEELILFRVQREPDGRRVEVRDDRGASLRDGLALEPGAWIVQGRDGDGAVLRAPLVLRRGEVQHLRLRPAPPATPAGFVSIPEGTTTFGSTADEVARRDFYFAAPAHPRTVAAFLIARHETTFEEWLSFLDALPVEEQARRAPRVDAGGFRGGLALARRGGGWELSYQPGATRFVARQGERLSFDGRPGGVDWTRLPVAGVSFEDAEAYAAWLAKSGRVPGARVCTELEWERAARGADGREYPHGDRLLPGDANHDATYGKRAEAMAPDEVGSYPRSRSPFGVDDLTGNVFEWVRPVMGTEPLAKGGSFSYGVTTARISNRERVEPAFRDASLGIRVCADPPVGADPD